MNNSRKKLFVFIVLLSLVCAVAAGCSGQSAPLPEPAGCYRVSEILYVNPSFSFSYSLDTAPTYTVSDRLLLTETGGITGEAPLNMGTLTETSLSQAEFAELFPAKSADFDPAPIGKKLRRAWRTAAVWEGEDGASVEIICLLLQLESGEFLLSYGYSGDGPACRWLFRLGQEYVSRECLYMNPLSSYFAPDGDSGDTYTMAADAFTITSRQTGEQKRIPVDKWEWQRFPYTDAQWAALYSPSKDIEDISRSYTEMRYQPLDDSNFLLQMDGELWLAELRKTPEMGEFLWSIYTLTPECGDGQR